MLTANIDDMPGEAFGYLLEQLMGAGALDVAFLPMTMKKSRPGVMVQVVSLSLIHISEPTRPY